MQLTFVPKEEDKMVPEEDVHLPWDALLGPSWLKHSNVFTLLGVFQPNKMCSDVFFPSCILFFFQRLLCFLSLHVSLASLV